MKNIFASGIIFFALPCVSSLYGMELNNILQWSPSSSSTFRSYQLLLETSPSEFDLQGLNHELYSHYENFEPQSSPTDNVPNRSELRDKKRKWCESFQEASTPGERRMKNHVRKITGENCVTKRDDNSMTSTAPSGAIFIKSLKTREKQLSEHVINSLKEEIDNPQFLQEIIENHPTSHIKACFEQLGADPNKVPNIFIILRNRGFRPNTIITKAGGRAIAQRLSISNIKQQKELLMNTPHFNHSTEPILHNFLDRQILLRNGNPA